jgi:hypothetical protein
MANEGDRKVERKFKQGNLTNSIKRWPEFCLRGIWASETYIGTASVV